VLTAFGAHAAGFATARRCLRFLVLSWFLSPCQKGDELFFVESGVKVRGEG